MRTKAIQHAAQKGGIARALAARQRAAPGQHVDIGIGRDGAAERRRFRLAARIAGIERIFERQLG
jgi:hypothetical protein